MAALDYSRRAAGVWEVCGEGKGVGAGVAEVSKEGTEIIDKVNYKIAKMLSKYGSRFAYSLVVSEIPTNALQEPELHIAVNGFSHEANSSQMFEGGIFILQQAAEELTKRIQKN